MLGPIIWLALAFAVLIIVRVIWVILLQPEPMIRRDPVDSTSRAEVVRWAGQGPDAEPAAPEERAER